MANIFSVDIGEKFTRLIELRPKDKNIEILQMALEQTTSNFYNSESEKNVEVEGNIISKICSTLKIKEKSVQIIIPDTYSYCQTIVVPQLNEKELQSAIRYQADQFIPLPIEEISLDIQVLNEDKKTKQSSVLLVASPKKVINQIERTVEYAGLFPEFIENEFSAVRRAIIEKNIFSFPSQSTYIIINFGFSGSSLYLVNLEKQLFLNRNLKIGLQLLVKDIMVNMNTDDKKADEVMQNVGFSNDATVEIEPYIAPIINELIEEINRLSILAKERYNLSPQQLYIFNYDSYVFNLDKYIEKTTSLPTLTIPLDQIILKNNQVAGFQKEISGFFSVIATSLL